jgi:hypothetical protein
MSIWNILCRDRRPDNWRHTLVSTYQAISSASVDDLWQTVINLADFSWHPLITETNVPNGLTAKPGLIFQAVTRLIPIPVRLFVERVAPQEMLSIRLIAFPGVEERVTYRIESTLCGTRISYSVALRGWLSPLAWSLIRPYAAQVAINLAQAAEQPEMRMLPSKPSQRWCQDLFSFSLIIGAGLLSAHLGCSEVICYRLA